MVERRLENLVYNDLTTADVADYFGAAFNSDKMQKIITEASSLSKAGSYYKEAARMLLGYLEATGDTSSQGWGKILDDFALYKDEAGKGYDNKTGTEAWEKCFGTYVMPEILRFQLKKQNLDGLDEEQKLTKALEATFLQGMATKFYTHAFNGALGDDIKRDGLDISKEKFVEEYALFQKYGLQQVYKKGVLCVADMTPQGLEYALGVPERLSNTLNHCGAERQNNETRREFLSRALEGTLQQKTELSPNEKVSLRQAGQKMIDFYTSKPGRQASIAFIKDDVPQPDAENLARFCQSAQRTFMMTFQKGVSRYATELKRLINDDEGLKTQLAEIAQSQTGDDKLIGKICRFCVDLNRRYDNVPKPLKMQSENNFLSIPVIKDGLSRVISVHCLYNFAHGGYADGYEVPNGKIPAEKMSICSFDNPYDAYAIAQKTNERFEQMMQTQYKKNVYKQKYAVEIRRGVQPKESFDEFCQVNPFLTRVMKPEENGVIKTVEHPQFTAWKKKHQYDNPNSLQTINLKRRARENVLCKEDNVDIRSGFRQNGAESR